VEDDAKMAELLRRGLSSEGHSVDVAGDGLKGLGKGQRLPFDAIVSVVRTRCAPAARTARDWASPSPAGSSIGMRGRFAQPASPAKGAHLKSASRWLPFKGE
jgi:CheY-like chemotaxis protein